MKKIVLILFTILSFGTVKAQSGILDNTFDSDGFSEIAIPYELQAMELQSDGKIVTLSRPYSGDDNVIARYNSDGSLDLSLNGSGSFTYTSSSVRLYDLIIQPDGKYLAVGIEGYNAVVFRFNDNGTIDNSFGIAGKATFSQVDKWIYGLKIALQPDGKIVIGGYYHVYDDFHYMWDDGYAFIARFNTNGTLDNGFGTSGYNFITSATLGSPWVDKIGGLIVESNGNITLCGSTTIVYNEDIFVWRLTSNGAYDLTFDSDGHVTYDQVNGASLGLISSISQQSNGNYVLACRYNSYIFILNLTSSGAPNSSFNGSGLLVTSFDMVQGASSGSSSVYVQSDDKILFTHAGGKVSRVNTDGTYDSSFGNSGHATADNGFNMKWSDIEIQPDNKILLGGTLGSLSNSCVSRLVNCSPVNHVDEVTSCESITWIDGNTYTSSINGPTYTYTGGAVNGCDSIVTLNLTVNTIADQSLSTLTPVICDNGTVTISSASSEIGLNYYLRDDADDSVIDGPIAGTGSSLDFSTGSISTTTTYNVYVEKADNSIQFDGIDDKVQVAGPNLASQSFTIEFWGKRNSTGTHDFFLGQGIGQANKGLHIGFRNTNEFTFAFFSNDLNTPQYTDFNWHHWAMTFNATNNERKIYRDGVVVASDIAAGGYIGTGILTMGDNSFGGGNVNGNMDEVRIWNSARSLTDIQSFMNTCMDGNESGLLAYYKFNETPGTTTVTDNSLNGFDGGLVNMDQNTAWQPGYLNCGCSIELTDLVTITVNNSTTGTDTKTACNSYTWIDGNTYTSSNNTATHTLTNAAGCDSIVTLNLTINNSTTGTDVQTACNTFIWIDGNTYTSSNNTATHTLTNAAGCDSIVTLNLTINNSNTGTDVQTACNTFIWIDGNTYTSSNNTATHTLTNAAGCDSIVTLNLTINNSNTGTDVQTACNTFTWIDGNTYTSSNNTATHTLTNVAGCDSVVTLNLTINSVADITTTLNGLSISANNTNASYQWLDCDNNFAMINGETSQIFAAITNGNYAVELTENGCVDTSACVSISTVGIIDNNFGSTVNLFPNPTNGSFSIDLGTMFETIEVSITDITGKLILSKTFNTTQILNLFIEEPAGIYFVNMYSNEMNTVIKLIKE